AEQGVLADDVARRTIDVAVVCHGGGGRGSGGGPSVHGRKHVAFHVVAERIGVDAAVAVVHRLAQLPARRVVAAGVQVAVGIGRLGEVSGQVVLVAAGGRGCVD